MPAPVVDSPSAVRPFTQPRHAAAETLQTPVLPEFHPEREFTPPRQAVEAAVTSPTHSPRARRRIKPTTAVVLPVGLVPSTAEQRARAVAWNVDTYCQRPAQRTNDYHTEAELEQMLLPTPSPKQRPVEERKLTVEEQAEELELERT